MFHYLPCSRGREKDGFDRSTSPFNHGGADHLAYISAPYDALELLPVETVSMVREAYGSGLMYERDELQEMVTILESVLGER